MTTASDARPLGPVTGRWSLQKDAQRAPYGTVEVVRNGEVLGCLWALGDEGHATKSAGCGFTDDGAFVASRCQDKVPSGVVVYRVEEPGRLKASWTFSGKTRKGGGFLSDGPRHGWSGTYVAHYAYVDEEGKPDVIPEMLVEVVEQREVFLLQWFMIGEGGRKGDLQFEGVGVVSDGRLVAAWGIPRSDIQLLLFGATADKDVLAGECAAHASASRERERMTRLSHAVADAPGLDGTSQSANPGRSSAPTAA